MLILGLTGPQGSPLLDWIADQPGMELIRHAGPPDVMPVGAGVADFTLLHGYRHILRAPWLQARKGPVANLHISMLPWNRGADPNLWSFLEDTPKGVTLHLVDAGVDTGAILLQEPVEMVADDTLATSYARLQKAGIAMVKRHWRALLAGEIVPRPQGVGGSLHRLKDKEPYLPLLGRGFDTPVAELAGKALERGRR